MFCFVLKIHSISTFLIILTVLYFFLPKVHRQTDRTPLRFRHSRTLSSTPGHFLVPCLYSPSKVLPSHYAWRQTIRRNKWVYTLYSSYSHYSYYIHKNVNFMWFSMFLKEFLWPLLVSLSPPTYTLQLIWPKGLYKGVTFRRLRMSKSWDLVSFILIHLFFYFLSLIFTVQASSLETPALPQLLTAVATLYM